MIKANSLARTKSRHSWLHNLCHGVTAVAGFVSTPPPHAPNVADMRPPTLLLKHML